MSIFPTSFEGLAMISFRKRYFSFKDCSKNFNATLEPFLRNVLYFDISGEKWKCLKMEFWLFSAINQQPRVRQTPTKFQALS